ncbi:hypothetical protein D9611_014453 [Ephemerocybe angulata]|uniref:Protein kinase domain-containing protein n=1 Tax=Ephemerocybe angulata TaxID=980116 RepID=A0A8H5ERJ5_9AGAR|nr:hypothetical protein D9611_014453 [Tulosesus angulatus]
MERFTEPPSDTHEALPWVHYALSLYEDACRMIVLRHLAGTLGCASASSHKTEMAKDRLGDFKDIWISSIQATGVIDISAAAEMFTNVVKDKPVNETFLRYVRSQKLQNELDINMDSAAKAIRDKNEAKSMGEDVSGNLKGKTIKAQGFSPADEQSVQQSLDAVLKLAAPFLAAVRSLVEGTTNPDWIAVDTVRGRIGDLAFLKHGNRRSDIVSIEVKKWGSNTLNKIYTETRAYPHFSEWTSHKELMAASKKKLPDAEVLKEKGPAKRDIVGPRGSVGKAEILHQIIVSAMQPQACGFISLTDFLKGWVDLECDGSDETTLKLKLTYWGFTPPSKERTLHTIPEEDEGREGAKHVTAKVGKGAESDSEEDKEKVKDMITLSGFFQDDDEDDCRTGGDIRLLAEQRNNKTLIHSLQSPDYVGWKPAFDFLKIGSELGYQALRFTDTWILGGPPLFKQDPSARHNLDVSHAEPGAVHITSDNTIPKSLELKSIQISSFFHKIASSIILFLFTLLKPDFYVSGNGTTLNVDRSLHLGPLFSARIAATVPTRQGYIMLALFNTVVIKVFDHHEHYEKELQVYADMRGCAGILPLLATGATPNGHHFIVLPYVGDCVTEISDADARYIYDNALKHMHAKQYHHHDIHRENVLRNRSNGNLYLIDFCDVEQPCTFDDCACFDRGWMAKHGIQEAEPDGAVSLLY